MCEGMMNCMWIVFASIKKRRKENVSDKKKNQFYDDLDVEIKRSYQSKNFREVSRFGAWNNNDIANLNDSWMKMIFFIFTFGVFGMSERSKF